jgi:hypothetical protein
MEAGPENRKILLKEYSYCIGVKTAGKNLIIYDCGDLKEEGNFLHW